MADLEYVPKHFFKTFIIKTNKNNYEHSLSYL